MGQITDVLQAIINGVKSPTKAALGAIIALFMYFFILVQKGVIRDTKAENEKNDQKAEDNSQIENENSKADSSVRDRLQNRK